MEASGCTPGITSSVGPDWGREPRSHCSSRPSFGRPGSLQSAEQGLELVRTVVPRTIDVKGWRAVHAAPHAAQEVLADPFGVDVLGQLFVEHLDVQAELLGVGAEALAAQAPLLLVEEVVHLPELALGRGSLGGLGGSFGIGV